MEMKRFMAFIALLAVIVMPISVAFAWDDKFTHPALVANAISLYGLEKHLTVNLKVIDKSQFETLMDTLEKGSTAEDDPNCRAVNHFHNPLKLWAESGLSDYEDMPDLGGERVFYKLAKKECEDTGWRYNEIRSLPVWATGIKTRGGAVVDRLSPNPAHTKFDWDTARAHYYRALVAGDDGQRDDELKQSFDNLGHVLHLIQDAGVPAHTRNDFAGHIRLTGAGNKDVAKTMGRDGLLYVPALYFSNPLEFYVHLNGEKIMSETVPLMPAFGGPVYVTDYWDREVYDGSNPSVASGLDIGLAEYTNANFICEVV